MYVCFNAYFVILTSLSCRHAQVLRASPQVAPWTHAGVHLGLTGISHRCTCSICIACLVVWRPRRAADTSTNRRQGFLCRRTASMKNADDTAEASAVDQHCSSPAKTLPFCNRTSGKKLTIVLGDTPSVSQ